MSAKHLLSDRRECWAGSTDNPRLVHQLGDGAEFFSYLRESDGSSGVNVLHEYNMLEKTRISCTHIYYLVLEG